MKKEIISESRLREIISEEAARFKKKLTLEAEKKNLLKKLNEMYMEEDMMEEDMMEADTLDEVSLDAAAHKEASEFVNNHPKKDAIRTTYENGKQDREALKRFNSFVTNYAKNTLKLDNQNAFDFLRDVVRVLEDNVGGKVHSNTKSTFEEADTMEEALFGPSKEEIEANKQEFVKQLDDVLAKAPEGMKILPSKEEILKQAEKAKVPFKGELRLAPNSKKTFLVLSFKPALTKFQKAIQPIVGGMTGGHSFGSGAE